MNPSYITKKDFTVYIAPKLKWYQKILQKLHIKNYYKELRCTVPILEWSNDKC